MRDALENFHGFGVSSSASSPHDGSYGITVFDISYPIPVRRRSLLFQYSMGSMTVHGVCPPRVLTGREDHHQQRGGEEISSSVSSLLPSLC